MTIRKKWFIALLCISLLAILVTALLFGMAIREYFIGYLEEEYQKNIKDIQTYGKVVLTEKRFSRSQVEMNLRNFLDEPISSIELYDSNGTKIISISRSVGMMGHMRGAVAGIDTFNIQDKNKVIGQLVIHRSSSLQESETSFLFRRALIKNSMISSFIVILLVLVISFFISNRTTKELSNTAKLAKTIEHSDQVSTINYSKTEEVRMIQESLMALKRRLQWKQKLRKEKIDQIIHQSRTPITIMQSNIEASLDGIVTLDEARQENMLTQLKQLTHLIDHLDEVIVLNDSVEVHYKTFNLEEIIQKIVKGLEVKFKKKNIKLQYEYSGKSVIESDEHLIVQSIYNLINNAYKFTPEGGTVVVKVDGIGENLSISISDTGLGIDKSEQATIFKPYYRLSRDIEKEGKGLGLYIVKKNIEALDGEVSLVSDIGQGTTIIIKLRKNKPQK